jgi:hypothetical protein
MKNSVIIILFLLSVSKIFSQANDSLVLFTKSIGWNLFKGTPDSDTLGAKISTSLHLEIHKVNVWNGTLHFKAYALMNPSKSWVKSGYADEYTLQHEQTHFNLTEICARRLQTELKQMKLKSKKSTLIQATLSKWQSKLEVLQKKYDLETKGGNDHVRQNIWNEKIIAELIATEL